MLAFVNPGKFMDDFDPERSEREMKKMNRRLHKEKKLVNQVMYNVSIEKFSFVLSYQCLSY